MWCSLAGAVAISRIASSSRISVTRRAGNPAGLAGGFWNPKKQPVQ